MDKLFSFLVWSLPVSFCLHVTEEFFLPGGFVRWYHQYRPKFAGGKPSHYFKVNAVGFLAVLLTSISASRGNGFAGVLVVSGLLSCNAIFTHLFGAAKTKRYSPGMITGSVLYLPLTLVSYAAAIQFHKLDPVTLLFCVAVSPLPEIVFAKRKAAAA